MRACWASILGDCAGRVSGEHLVSKSLFDGGKFVTVMGGPWGVAGWKQIGINSFTVNALCRHHNSKLSEADHEAHRCLELFRRVNLENGQVNSGKIKRWNTRSASLNGTLLERWFVKTTVNFFVANGHRKAWFGGGELTAPPAHVVKAAFGVESLKEPEGLYNWAGNSVGDMVEIPGQLALGFNPIYKDGLFGGALYRFQGLNFLVWLVPAAPPWPGIKPFRHHMGGDFVARGITTHRLRFNW